MDNKVVADFVKSTAFLRRSFLGRDTFREIENTIFVFDTDVIKAYCAPWLTGPGRDQGGNGYGEPISLVEPEKKKLVIDERDRRQRAESVSEIFARHALFLNKTQPIYQFQAHFEDTADVYTYVRRDAEREAKIDEQSRADRRRRSIIQVSAIIAAKRGGGYSSRDISTEVDHLMRLLNETTLTSPSRQERNVREWDRFIDLNVKKGGIFPVGHAGRHFRRLGNIEVAHAIERFESISAHEVEGGILGALKSFWLVELVRLSSSSRSEDKLIRDAEALALLAVLNIHLRDIGWKAVFVTGSKNVVDASYSEIPSWIFKDYADALSRFSHQYVRHLWAYTSEALIEPHNQKKFVNWLDGLLANWAGKSEFQEEVLTKILSQRSFKNVLTSDCRAALGMWDAVTQTMVSQGKFIRLGDTTSDIQNKLVKRIELSRGEYLSWDRLVTLLIEENDRNNDETFLAFSNIGAESLISSQQASRHPPDLDFESLTNTKKIFKKLASVQGYRSRAEFETDFQAIRDECFDPEIDNRQYCHLRYLALGAAFASSSRWSVALSQAQRAIRIVERSIERQIMPIPKKDSLNSYMSGREAYFLAAVALRMIAKSPVDFDGSRRFLFEARKALSIDRGRGTAANFDELRFANEDLAQALGRYYFERSLNEDDLQDAHFLEVVLKLAGVLGPTGSFSPAFKLKSRRAATLAHAAINCIQARTIYEFRIRNEAEVPADFPISNEVLGNALNLVRALAVDEPGIGSRLFQTKLMKCYLVVGDLMLSNGVSLSVDGVNVAFQDWDKFVVTDYDSWRYKSLYKLACKLLDGTGHAKLL